MRFLWSGEDFDLSKTDVAHVDGEIVLRNDALRRAFETHHAVLVDRFIIDEDELTHNTYICAELRFSLQFGEDEEARADVILLTRQERRLFGMDDLPEFPEGTCIPRFTY